ncbi:chorismate mutase [bacterium]|nr:chorismate mutase [bacterium]
MKTLKEVERIRKQIDKLDKNLILLLEKRLGLVQKIWQLKKEKNLPLLDPEREKQMIEQALKLETANLSKKDVERLYTLILDDFKNFLF